MTAAVNSIKPAPVDGVLARLGRTLWPPRCLCCGARGSAALDLCQDCAATLPWNHHACSRCALPLPALDHADEPALATCGACFRRPPPLHAVHAACLYDAPLDRLLPRFKFHHDLAVGRLLAQLMATQPGCPPGPATLLPIPLHARRLRQRGYDQALELARPLAAMSGLPLLDGALIRQRDTTPQSRLDAAQRQRNLRRAFAVRPDLDLPAHVVLVDDVMTTGATLHAAADALRRAGVARIDAWVCARVA